MVLALILGGFVVGHLRGPRDGRLVTEAATAPSSLLDRGGLGACPRDARRHAPRPDPHPVGQPAGSGSPGRGARRGAPHRGPARRPPGCDRRSSSRSPAAGRSTPACAATAPAASRCSCCRTSTSCRRRPTAGRHDPFAAEIADGLRLRPRRRRHEGHGRDGARRRPPAGRRGPRGRARPGPGPDPRPPARRPVHVRGRRGGGRRRRGEVDRRRIGRIGSARPAPSTSAAASSTTVAGGRLYPIQVAEKGFAAYRIAVRGTWGHGSMPRDGQRRGAGGGASIERLAVPGPIRVTPVMARFLDRCGGGPAGGSGPGAPRRSRRRPGPSRGGARRLCDPMYARALRALLRDTISPDVDPRRGQVQRHPGRRRRRGRLPGAAGHDRAGDARRARPTGSARSSRPSARSS